MLRRCGWLLLALVLLSAGAASAQTVTYQTSMDVAFTADADDAEGRDRIATAEVEPNETLQVYVVLQYTVDGTACVGSLSPASLDETVVTVRLTAMPSWTNVTLAETRTTMGGACDTDTHVIPLTISTGSLGNVTSAPLTVHASAEEGSCSVADCDVPAAEDDGTLTVSANHRRGGDIGDVDDFIPSDDDWRDVFPWVTSERTNGGTETQSTGVTGMLPFLVPIGFFVLVGFLGYLFMRRTDVPDVGASRTGAVAAAAAVSVPDAPRPGHTFLGKYHVEKELGRGNFGRTWLATHTGLDRKAVIKQLHPEWAAVEEARERFRREARILASLDHPYVTRVYDVEHVDGAWYLVMEYVDGGSLEDRLKDGAMTAYEAGLVAAQVLEGLACIHDEGILHRDLKPANVLLTSAGIVKIADFGVARSNAMQTNLTTSGISPGTPLYMAPEQVRPEGRTPDHRADLYAAAVLYYRCVTGGFYLATGTEDYFGLMRAVVEDPPTLPLDDLTPELNAWLAKALAKDPDARFQSARDMVTALIDAQNAATA